MNLIDDYINNKNDKSYMFLSNNNLFIKKKLYIEPTNPYGIISITLFQLEKSYKNNDNYYNGLKNIIHDFKKYFPTMYIRLYIDETVLSPKFKNNKTNEYIKNKWIPFINQIKKLDFVQIIIFDYKLFQRYYVKNNISKYSFGHEGLFGTILRFEPLFNFEENKNLRIVYVTDIDLGKTFFTKRYEGYKKFLLSNSEFYFKCLSSSYLNPRFYVLKDYTTTWCRITASMIISKIKLPCQLYTDFIKILANKINIPRDPTYQPFTESKLMILYSEQIDRFLQSDVRREKTAGYKTIIEYGIDELLMTIVLEWLVQSNKKLAYYYIPEFSRVLWNYSNKYIDLNTQIQTHKSSTFICTNNFKFICTYILGKYYNNNISLKKNYKYIDEIFYKEENISSINTSDLYKYCTNKFLLLCKKMLETNTYAKYGFNKDEVEAILRIIYLSPKIEPILYIKNDDRIYYTFKLI